MKKTELFIRPHFNKCRPKFFLTMRLTAFFILATALQVSAKSYSQEKVSVNFENTRLDRALKEVEKISSFHFVYSDLILKDKIKVTLHAKDIMVEDLVKKLLENTGLTFSVMDNNLVVIKQAISLNDIIVNGKITDSKGKPLQGVSVKIVGKNIGTTTDANGVFSLNVSGNDKLEISFVGYETQIIKVDSRKEINVVMEESVSQLNEVVVIGYGTTTKKDITSSVATVDMAKVSEIASPSINDELGGRMPGVFVTFNGGGPGQQAQIFVRGGNGGNNPPLFVIDGFIRSESDYLNLNPNDVQSLVVLKDAEATAVYGSQGGNGVVIVTTKQGKVGKPTFNYTFNQIWTQPTNLPNVLGSYAKASATNQAYQNLGLTPPYADSVLQYYKDQSEPYIYPNTNWRKLVLNNFAHEERHDFSLSGGNDAIRYYGGLSYYHQGSIIKTPNNYNNRVTYRLNIESNLKKIGLKINAGIDGYVNTNVQPNSVDGGYFGIFSHIVDASPMGVAVNQYGLPYIGAGVDNPLVEISSQAGYSKAVNSTINGILDLDWSVPFVKGLQLEGKSDYTMSNSMDKSWDQTGPEYALGSTTPVYSSLPNLSETDGSGNNWDLQSIIHYNRSFGKNRVDFTGVYERITGGTQSLSASRQSFIIPIDQFFAGPTVNQVGTGAESVSASEGYVGRLQYNYEEKYFLEGSLRYDGSYLFPPDKRFGLFYGLSGGWIPTEEKFLQFLKDDHILDYLKIRGSYGIVGNTNGVSPYAYLSTYNIVSNAYVVGGQPQSGLSENGLASSAFTWYSNKSSNIGLDFTTLENRLSGSLDYYYYVTSGFVISDTAYAVTLGQNLPVTNSNASQRTAGYEFGLNWSDHVGSVKYRVGITYSYYNSLYPLYPGENTTAISNPYSKQSGVLQDYYTTGYVANGLYSSNASVLNGPLLAGTNNVAGGDIQYKDINGDGQINSNDIVRIGSSNFPHANYGLTLGMQYKGWSLDANLMGTGNREVTLGSILQGNSPQNILVYPFQLDYWSPSNPKSLFPRQLPSSAYNGNNNNQTSTYWLINARYIRLKSLNLSYDLKRLNFLHEVPFTQFRVFATGRNLFTISKTMKYYIDPESDPSGWGYSVQRTFALGCNIGF